jgi:multidrug efflux pump subunit AcrA (membrane-fusion protein)
MLIRNGQDLGEFTSTDIYELEASVGLQDIRNIKRGQSVQLTSDDIPGHFEGVIARINDKIDQSSQTVIAYIATSDKRLKDGMYLTAHITTRTIKATIKVPQRVIDDDFVYGLKDSTVIKYTVELIGTENGNVIINGVPDGVIILDEDLKNIADGTHLSEIVLD